MSTLTRIVQKTVGEIRMVKYFGTDDFRGEANMNLGLLLKKNIKFISSVLKEKSLIR